MEREIYGDKHGNILMFKTLLQTKIQIYSYFIIIIIIQKQSKIHVPKKYLENYLKIEIYAIDSNFVVVILKLFTYFIFEIIFNIFSGYPI